MHTCTHAHTHTRTHAQTHAHTCTVSSSFSNTRALELLAALFQAIHFWQCPSSSLLLLARRHLLFSLFCLHYLSSSFSNKPPFYSSFLLFFLFFFSNRLLDFYLVFPSLHSLVIILFLFILHAHSPIKTFSHFFFFCLRSDFFYLLSFF